MAEALTPREEAQNAFLSAFATVTGLPIGLCIVREGQLRVIHPPRSLANFEDYCRRIQEFPGGKALCEADQCHRARTAFRSREALRTCGEELTLCYAGLYNQAVPIRVGGEIRAVLLYGEMHIVGEKYEQQALQKHQEAMAKLHLSEAEAAELRELWSKAKRYTPEQLQELRASLAGVEAWFYSFIDEEDRLRRSIEKVTHEMQTRLQAIIANAENLVVEMPSLKMKDAQRRALQLLYSTLALDTVVQSLGDYLEDYRFRKQPIARLLYEAKRLYEVEASRRGIDIYIRLQPDNPVLEISANHLQYAFNNLMHNAVKYSFRGGSGRSRYVQVLGQPEARYYRLTFENYGVGILPEEIRQGLIFREGYQGKLTQGEYRTGSGKGLYFVKRVIDRHHGYIKVESELMAEQETLEGQPHLTRFSVYLPYEQPKEEDTHGQDHRVD